MSSDAFGERVAKEMGQICGESVIPILASIKAEQTIRQHGTGTLFAIADERFLVTAAHVWTEAQEHNLHLYITDGTIESQLMSLHGTSVVAGVPLETDVAVIKLTEEVLTRIPNRRFLNLSHVAFENDYRAGRYFLYGWPSENATDDKVQKIVRASAFKYVTQIDRGSPPYNPHYDPRLHLLLAVPFESQGARPIGGSARARPRHFRGISGCSAWRITRTTSEAEEKAWRHEQAHIVAVQVGSYRENTVAKCVRWIVVAAILYFSNPARRDLMSILHPDIAADSRALADYLLKKLKSK